MRVFCKVCHKLSRTNTVGTVAIRDVAALGCSMLVCNECAEHMADVLDRLVDAMQAGLIDWDSMRAPSVSEEVDALVADVYTRGWKIAEAEEA